MITRQKTSLTSWIFHNTINSKTVVELGAGFFGNLSSVNPNVQRKIGIEVYKPYIDNAKYHDCEKIHGDLLNYRNLLTDVELDTVLIVDVLEHFDMATGQKLINNLKSDFKKILLMLPVGVHELKEDVTGFGGHEYQTHRSYWFEPDILSLNFDTNIIDSNFHYNKPSPGCYFGTWVNPKK